MTKYYYNNLDLRLLLNLLAESHGPATCLRVLALFDTEFNEALIVPDIIFPTFPPQISKRECTKNIAFDDGKTIKQKEVEIYNLDVSFEEAPASRGILMFMENISSMYTIELFPPTKKTCVIPVPVSKRSEKKSAVKSKDIHMTKIDNVVHKVLEDLEVSKEYRIRVNTIVDGHTLGHRTESFGPLKSKNY